MNRYILKDLDPTPTKKFTKWIIKIFEKETPNLDQFRNTIEEYFAFLERGKALTRDINQFISFTDLKREVDNLNESGLSLSISRLEKDYEIIIDNDKLLVCCPHSHEAARKLGLTKFAFRDFGKGKKDSNWCVTFANSTHFNQAYYKQGCNFYFIRIYSTDLAAQINETFGITDPNDHTLETVAIVILNGVITGYDAKDRVMSLGQVNKYLQFLVGFSAEIGHSEQWLISRRSSYLRYKNYNIATQRSIQKYIKNGCNGLLDLSNTPLISLPSNLNIVNGDLLLYNSNLANYTEGLTVAGKINLTNTPISKFYFSKKEQQFIWSDLILEGCYNLINLPDDLDVLGNLNIFRTNIESLPVNLSVAGDFNAFGTAIQFLPNSAQFGANVDLGKTHIQFLPSDFKVYGDLILTESKICELPDNLWVQGDLDLSFTEISCLPGQIYVGGNLILRDSLVASLPEGLIVKGSIDLTNTPIKFIPDNLSVGGSLSLLNTPLKRLPDNLNVGGSLIIKKSHVKDIPLNLIIGGCFNFGETPLGRLYKWSQLKKIVESNGGQIKGKDTSFDYELLSDDGHL